MSATSSRKEDHVRLCVEEDVSFRDKRNGLEKWEFEHNALPELNFNEIDTTTDFLGCRISFPLLVSGMTGGYGEARRINARLARICRELRLPFGVGSQRQTWENNRHLSSYSIVRKEAPDIPIIANIGAAEVAALTSWDPVLRIIDLVEADALAVHLNPLQEFLQPGGNPSFAGVTKKIREMVRRIPVPIIVKEVGAGISSDVAERIFATGVRWIDIAGAGGTSWAGIEMLRRKKSVPVSGSFWDWGIPTAEALRAVRDVRPKNGRIIASGGIEDGVMIAKVIALGADCAAAARPILRALTLGNAKRTRDLIEGWRNDLSGVMFLVGARNIRQLRRTKIRLKCAS